MRFPLAALFSILILAVACQAQAQSHGNFDYGDLYKILNYAVGVAATPQSFEGSKKASCNCRTKPAEEMFPKKVKFSCTILSETNTWLRVEKYKVGDHLDLTLKAKEEDWDLDFMDIDHLQRDLVRDDDTGETYQPKQLDGLEETKAYSAIDEYGLRQVKLTSLTKESAELEYAEGLPKDHLFSNGVDPEHMLSAKMKCQRVKNSDTQAR